MHVERREARLVLVEARPRRVDVEPVVGARTGLQRGDSRVEGGLTRVGGPRQEIIHILQVGHLHVVTEVGHQIDPLRKARELREHPDNGGLDGDLIRRASREQDPHAVSERDLEISRGGGIDEDAGRVVSQLCQRIRCGAVDEEAIRQSGDAPEARRIDRCHAFLIFVERCCQDRVVQLEHDRGDGRHPR